MEPFSSLATGAPSELSLTHNEETPVCLRHTGVLWGAIRHGYLEQTGLLQGGVRTVFVDSLDCFG